MARVNERSHSFTYHPHVYPQMKWILPAFTPSRRASPHFGRYSFFVLQRVEGWVGLSGWLQTEMVYSAACRRSPIPVLTEPGVQ